MWCELIVSWVSQINRLNCLLNIHAMNLRSSLINFTFLKSEQMISPILERETKDILDFVLFCFIMTLKNPLNRYESVKKIITMCSCGCAFFTKSTKYLEHLFNTSSLAPEFYQVSWLIKNSIWLHWLRLCYARIFSSCFSAFSQWWHYCQSKNSLC